MARDRVAGFLFFYDQWAGDTIHLTLAEEGAYIRLIAQLARHDGYVPDQEDYVCRLLRIRPARWRRVRATLIEHPHRRVLAVTDDGRIYSKRLLEELSHAWAAREQRRAAASSRWSSPERVKDKLGHDPTPNDAQREPSSLTDEHENVIGGIGSGDADALRAHMRSQCNKNKGRSSSRKTTSSSKTLPGFEEPTSPESPEGQETWASPFCEVFEERFHGQAPVGLIIKTVAPVRLQLATERGRAKGDLETLSRWRNYLADQRPGRYNLHHFTEAHGEYTTQAVDSRRTGQQGDGIDVEAHAAWKHILTELRKKGRMGEPDLSEGEALALDAVGGWDTLGRSLEKDLPHLQLRFVRAFKGQQR
jgi:uncharacterized protein YdaU (DUF1376 family)